MKKKKATGAVGYVMLFTMALVMVIVTLFMMAQAKLMTMQHDVDDALADAVLACLVADDVYYFETWESCGTGTIRFRDVNESYRIFRECMRDAIESETGFYENISYPEFICYEVEGDVVTVTYFSESGGRSHMTGRLGEVTTPAGTVVTKTSAYGKVDFEIESFLGDETFAKSRDLYCTLEIND